MHEHSGATNKDAGLMKLVDPGLHQPQGWSPSVWQTLAYIKWDAGPPILADAGPH